MATEGGCRTDGLGSTLCCTTQKLLPSEQFEVDSHFHYALRGYSPNGILGLTDESTLGYVLDAETYTLTAGSTVAVEEAGASLQVPMFHFTIIPGELGRSKY